MAAFLDPVDPGAAFEEFFDGPKIARHAGYHQRRIISPGHHAVINNFFDQAVDWIGLVKRFALDRSVHSIRVCAFFDQFFDHGVIFR